MSFRAGAVLSCLSCLVVVCGCLPGSSGSTDNRGPVADAGEAKTVLDGAKVVLDGSGSADPDGDSLVYQWRQLAGPSVILVNAGTANAYFHAPAVLASAVLTFQLTVSDDKGSRDSASVSVTVLSKESYPSLVVDALDDETAEGGEKVTLAGSARGGVGTLSYRWQQTSGNTVSLSDASSAVASFTAPKLQTATTLAFMLTVTDEAGQTQSQTMSVQVAATFSADAGDDVTTSPGLTATLSGSVIGGSGDATFEWTQTDGPNVVLSDANVAAPTFTAPSVAEDTKLTFLLRVVDAVKGTSTDTVTVTVDIPIVRFSTTMGEFAMLLRSEEAPLGVANFLRYVDEGFYVGLIIHRVIPPAADPNDMAIIQGGGWYPDFSPTMRYDPIPIESDNGLKNVRGTVAYARTAVPDSATSEFFINLNDNPGLDYVS
ncbi:MAG: peptidylprolyl isomerase, partial [Phycisphaerae bacterium]|nr:peptidylprolyl isomerase [Phycisphaerae bacterium]